MNFKETLAEKTVHAEDILTKYLPEEKGYQKKVIESMNYSVLAGGKRLRPILMEESFRLFGGNSAIVEPFMAALEMIHNYSLVHDDLPAMDNDEYRRGRKTTWNVYGEGMAVLAGDALLNKAFETAAEAFSMIGEAADIAARYAAVAKALQILANKAGIYGMIGGQCADICAEELPADQVTKELLWYIHKNKTAALIEAALMIGAVLAGAPDEAVKKLEQVAENIGIAFQIQDDILDVTGSEEALGKPLGSDEKQGKTTFVTMLGLEGARRAAQLYTDAAVSAANHLTQPDFFIGLAQQLMNRDH